MFNCFWGESDLYLLLIQRLDSIMTGTVIPETNLKIHLQISPGHLLLLFHHSHLFLIIIND